MTAKPLRLFVRRRRRIRHGLRRLGRGRARLSVFRSGKHIYAQIIDDVTGRTLASASSIDRDLRSVLKNGATRAAAEAVGQSIAARAKEAGLSEVIFDRGGYIYHGRLKALAEAAREGGLKF